MPHRVGRQTLQVSTLEALLSMHNFLWAAQQLGDGCTSPANRLTHQSLD